MSAIAEKIFLRMNLCLLDQIKVVYYEVDICGFLCKFHRKFVEKKKKWTFAAGGGEDTIVEDKKDKRSCSESNQD